MPKERKSLLVFNRGLISRLGIARVDLPRTSLSSAVHTNFMPRTLGSMMLRAGLGYIDGTKDFARAKLLPFIFAFDDQAQLEFTDGQMRARIDDALVTRPTVTAAVTNGTFNANIAGWTDSDEAGAASTWLTGGYAKLLGTGTNAAILDQQVTVNEASTEHALRIVIARGPVILRVGSTSGDDDYISETTLGTGTHSLAFTPTGNFFIRVMNRRSFSTLVDSVTVEAGTAMAVPTPWSDDDFQLLRDEQSGDVVYIACKDLQQRKIERRAARSWSVVKYEPETGPFRNVNVTPITLTPSGLTGDITLTASKAFFRATNVESLFRIQSTGQTVTASISAQDTFTNEIRVNGVGGQRSFGVTIAGTFSATLTLQYSVGEPGNWVDVGTYTVPQSVSFNDALDNQVIFYRIGVKSGDYVSGTANVTLAFTSGSITGVARVTSYTSPTVVNAVVLADFGAITASSDWWEGQWSDRRGWPSAVCLHESRLGEFGADKINLSISDQYEDFDDNFVGDAGPISRSIGQGPIETIPWALSLTRLIIGTLSSSANIKALKIQGNNPLSGRSSSLDEPLTPTNFNLKTVAPTGIFVDTSTTKLFELKFDINENDYVPEDLCIAVPDLNEVGIAGIAVQYKPDMRVHAWRNDGTVAVMVRDRAENVICWLEVETDGFVEDVCVMPSTVEDRVYYTVRRTVSGVDARYIEKFALESECRGGTLNKQADAFLTGTNSPASATITGLGIHEGCEVIVWADGRDFSPRVNGVQRTYTVVGGQITLDEIVTNWVVGRGYRARWKSSKLAFATALGTALNVLGKIDHIGFVLLDTHAQGLRYGPTFDDLDPLPLIEDEEAVPYDTIHDEYDEPLMEFDGDWSSDPRVCLEAQAPRPCTVAAVTLMQTKSG